VLNSLNNKPTTNVGLLTFSCPCHVLTQPLIEKHYWTFNHNLRRTCKRNIELFMRFYFYLFGINQLARNLCGQFIFGKPAANIQQTALNGAKSLPQLRLSLLVLRLVLAKCSLKFITRNCNFISPIRVNLQREKRAGRQTWGRMRLAGPKTWARTGCGCEWGCGCLCSPLGIRAMYRCKNFLHTF